MRETKLKPSSSLFKICLIVALLCAFAQSQGSPKTDTVHDNPQLSSILEQMQKAQSGARPTTSYQVIREYRLFGERGPDPSSEVIAEVNYLPPNQKSFVIQKRVGSSRGEDVVRRILQHETQMTPAGKNSSGGALNSDNYSFGYLGESTRDGSACYLLSLNPKRKDTELVIGKVWVDQHSFLIRHIEGQMAKNPSWMLKRVDLKIDFADVGGAWLQTGAEAVADVRFMGRQRLESQTVDARVGNLVAEKTPQDTRPTNRKAHHSDLPASVIVPLNRHH